MVNQVEPKLLEPLLTELQYQRLVTLSTVDYETGGPNVNAISWVFAKDDKTIMFVVHKRSRIVKNIKNNKKVVINVIMNKSSYSISGNAHIKETKLGTIPLKLALIKLDITEVRDVMFYGAEITSEPEFEFTYDKEAAERLNKQIDFALKRT